jgi:ribosomal protein S14
VATGVNDTAKSIASSVSGAAKSMDKCQRHRGIDREFGIVRLPFRRR